MTQKLIEAGNRLAVQLAEWHENERCPYVGEPCAEILDDDCAGTLREQDDGTSRCDTCGERCGCSICGDTWAILEWEKAAEEEAE